MERQRLLWRTLWEASGAPSGQEESSLFEELDARYREPHRVYHGWPHILACLRELDGAGRLCADPVAVRIAAWYHDAVYDPRARDNEARSAEMAGRAAARMGFGEQRAETVRRLVLLTTHAAGLPAEPAARADASVLLDVDLAILGSSPQAFASYERAIRAEYGFLSEDDYRQGRIRVLRSFLDRTRIYLTETYGERLEVRARENLCASLARLEGRSG